MADIQSTAAEIRRGKKDRKKEERRKKLQGKNIMAPLLHRAAIKNETKNVVLNHGWRDALRSAMTNDDR